MEGWVKIHRKILESPAIKGDPEALAIWVYILTNAAYKPYYTYFNGQKTLINAGQLITGRKKIAENTGVSESKIFRTLKRFESEQQIEQRPTPNGSLISVINWALYQESEQPNEQRMNNERTTNEQRMNTKKENKEYKEDQEQKQILNNITVTEEGEESSLVGSSVPLDPIYGMNKKVQERLKAFREKTKEVKHYEPGSNNRKVDG